MEFFSYSLRRMWRFGKSDAVEPAEVDAEAELRQRYCATKTELAKLNADILALKGKHALRLNPYDQIIGLRATSLVDRPAIEAQWRQLMARRVSITPRWATVLDESKRYWNTWCAESRSV